MCQRRMLHVLLGEGLTWGLEEGGWGWGLVGTGRLKGRAGWGILDIRRDRPGAAPSMPWPAGKRTCLPGLALLPRLDSPAFQSVR